MKAIKLKEVAAHKREDIRNYEANREYAGNAATDQRIEYVERMSDEEYMNMYNEVVTRENRKSEQRKERQAAISAERKSTGMSKKSYRAEYDRLMAEYKSTGNLSFKTEAKKIQRFAF